MHSNQELVFLPESSTKTLIKRLVTKERFSAHTSAETTLGNTDAALTEGAKGQRVDGMLSRGNIWRENLSFQMVVAVRADRVRAHVKC